MTRVVKKSGAFSGPEGMDTDACARKLAAEVALRPGEEVSSIQVLSDKLQPKVTLESRSGKGQTVYRVTGLPETKDFEKLAEARQHLREGLKANPERRAEVNRVTLKEGGAIVSGSSVLVKRSLTVEVTVVKP